MEYGERRSAGKRYIIVKGEEEENLNNIKEGEGRAGERERESSQTSR